MQLETDTGVDSSVFQQDVDFTATRVLCIAALALHSHRRDQALFQPGYVSTRTRGLLWYYNKKRQTELIRQAGYYVQAAVAQKIIEKKQGQVRAIIAQAETADATTLAQLLEQATGLQAEIETMAETIKRLATGAEQPQPPRGHQP